MSTTVDNRVVEMRFDNKEFESGVSTSISSLEKLKKALNLKGTADSFDEIEKASRRLDFNSIGNAVDAINNKFSILGTVGDQILRRIGDAIYDVQAKAVSLVKSLSVDQISAGWDKYAEKTQSVQTIMAATANDYDDVEKQMADVNAQLDKLNWFTDETSYNFVDMTSNIGKFTSNGQKLDASVTAMQGIAVWAAVSGANASEASRAMYNLSQALSVGGVKLIDWKSIENANMATVEFKQTAIDTAVAMGTLKQTSEGVYETLSGHEVTLKSFNQNLSDMWFTSEVLMETLNKYGGFTNELNSLYESINGDFEVVTTSQILQYIEDYQNGVLDLSKVAKITGMDVDTLEEKLKVLGSAEFELGRKAFRAAQEAKTFEEAINATKDAVSTGWMNTFELIFGNYIEAKKLWTTVANEMWEVFAGGGAERNAMLRDWHQNGGYEQLWQGVSNLWEGLKGIGEKIGEVWSNIFPGLDSDKLLAITEKFYNFSERFRDAFVGVEETIESVVEPAAAATEQVVSQYQSSIESLDALVEQVWAGVWGNGDERRRMLEEAGYYYELVQNAVNESAGYTAAYTIDEERLASAIGETIDVVEDATSATEKLGEETADASDTLDDISVKETAYEVEDLAGAEEIARTSADDLADVLGGLGSALSLIIDVAKLAGKYLVFPALKIGVGVIQKALAFMAPFSREFSSFVAELKANNTIERNIQKVVTWLQDVKNLASEQENVKKFLENFQRFKEWISGIKDSALTSITDFFSRIAGYDIQLPSLDDAAAWLDRMAERANRLIDVIETGWPQVKEFFEGLDFSSVGTFAATAADTVSQFISNLFTNDQLKETGRGWLDSLIDGLTERASEVDWGNVFSTILKALGAATGASIGFGFSDLLFGLGDLAAGAATIPTKIAGILGGVKKVLVGYSMDLKADALLKIAAAIGIFALALIGLSLVPAGNLVTVVGALIPLIGVLIGMAAVIGKFWGSTNTLADAVDGSLVSIGKINIKLPKLALTLGALAAVILSIVAAVAIFGFMPYDKLMQGLGALAGVVVGLVLVVGLLSVYGGKMENAGKMARAFIGIAVALDLLIPVIVVLTLLAMINGGNALFGGVFALIVSLAAMAVALGVLSASIKDIKSVGGQLILMALALDLLIPVLVTLSLLSMINGGNALAGAVFALIVVLAAMAGAFVLIDMAKDPKSAIKSMLAMAVGLVAIAAALAVLSGQKFGDMMKAVGAIAILVVALGALGFVAGTFSPIAVGMLAIGASVTLLGAGLLLAGVGALAFAKALQLLADSSVDAKAAGTNLAEGIVAFFDVLMEKGQSIAQFVALIIGVVLAVIVAHKAKMVMTIVGIVEALAQALTSGGTLAIILTALGALLAALLVWLGEKTANLASSIVSLILILIASVVKGILDNLTLIRQLVVSVIQTIGMVIIEAIIALVEGSGLGPLIEALGGSWWTDFKNAASGAEQLIANDLDAIIGDLQSNVDKQAEALRASGDELDAAAQEVYDIPAPDKDAPIVPLLETTTSGIDQAAVDTATSIDNYASTFESGSDQVATGIAGFMSAITENGGSLEEAAALYEEGGDNAVIGYVNKLLEGTDQAGEAATLFGNASVEGLFGAIQSNSPSKLTEMAGGYFAEGYALGINAWSWLATSAVQRMANASIAVLSNLGYRSYTYGMYFDLGLANGISAFSYLINAKVRAIAQSALNTLAATINSHSPSKETEKYGKYFDQGFAIGVEGNSYRVQDAIESVGNSALTGMHDVIQRISDAMDGDFDDSLTIRPVLDLSDVRTGASGISAIMNGQSLSGMASLRDRINTLYLTASGASAHTTQAAMRNLQTSFIESMDQQNAIMSDVKTLLSKQQIVLDDGTVVGVVSRRMASNAQRLRGR